MLVEFGRRNPATGGQGASVEPPVPDGDDEVGVADGQGTGEVERVGSEQRLIAGELAGVALHRRGELDRPGRCPVAFPVPLGGVQFRPGDVMVAGGCRDLVRFVSEYLTVAQLISIREPPDTIFPW